MLNILHIFNTMSEGISILTSGWSHLSQLWITASDVITALHQRSAKVKDDLMPLLESWTQSVVSLGLWPSRWSTGESQAAQRHFLSTSEATLMFKPVQTAGNHRSKALCILKYIYYSSSSLIKYPSLKTLLRVCVCVYTHSKRKQEIFHLQQLLYTSTRVCSWLPQTSLFHGFDFLLTVHRILTSMKGKVGE